jgi:hypothetical protein
VTAPAGGLPPEDETVRHLRLRGGELDGTTWSGVIAVGRRVFAGPGLWSKERVYVVTADTVAGPTGEVESIAVPADF